MHLHVCATRSFHMEITRGAHLKTQAQTPSNTSEPTARVTARKCGAGKSGTKVFDRDSVNVFTVRGIIDEIGPDHTLQLHTDPSASLGHCCCRRNGNTIRQLQGAELWIQQVLRQHRAKLMNRNERPSKTSRFIHHQFTRHRSVLWIPFQ